MMNTQDEALAARIGRALGSNRIVDLGDLRCGGPLDLLQLRAEVKHIQRSEPTVECHLAVSANSWRQLEALVEELRNEGEQVSLTELARLLARARG